MPGSVPVPPHQSARWRLWGLSLAAFICGVMVYALDAQRSGYIWFVPSSPLFPSVAFPAELGWSLPSMAHTFAFCMAAALVWADTRRRAYLVCGVWTGVELFMELVQISAVTSAFALLRLGDAVTDVLVLGFSGTFSGLDVGAVLLGGLTACWVSRFHWQEVHHV